MDREVEGCICKQRKEPLRFPLEYPVLKEGDDPVALLNEDGYFVVRDFLTLQEVNEVRQAITDVCQKWYANFVRTGGREGPDWEEVVNRRPAWKNGTWSPEPGQEELGVRKLYRMTQFDPFFYQHCGNQKIMNVVHKVLGPNIKLVQSMALLKPPGGAKKNWHQDNAYFRLTPAKIMGLWIALDKANCENGCMHMLPKSQHSGFYKHSVGTKLHIDYAMEDTPNPEDVVPVIMHPGDALFFTGHTAHYTPVNVTDSRRRSLQYHYAASECKFIQCPKEGEVLENNPTPQPTPGPDGPKYFDCDPSCSEKKYFYYPKGEMLVTGKDYGEGHI